MKHFAPTDVVFYPGLGVGTIVSQEIVRVDNTSTDMYVVSLPEQRATLRVPTARAIANGLTLVDALATEERIAAAWKVLASKAKRSGWLWTRREAKFNSMINSGDPISLATVARDCVSQNDSAVTTLNIDFVRSRGAQLLAELIAHKRGLPLETVQDDIAQRLKRAGHPPILFWKT